MLAFRLSFHRRKMCLSNMDVECRETVWGLTATDYILCQKLFIQRELSNLKWWRGRQVQGKQGTLWKKKQSYSNLTNNFVYIQSLIILNIYFFLLALQPPLGVVFYSPLVGFSLLAYEVFLITHNDAQHSVGLLWTNDQSVAETSTWQHTTLTTDKYPCPGWDSNSQSQQASGQISTP